MIVTWRSSAFGGGIRFFLSVEERRKAPILRKLRVGSAESLASASDLMRFQRLLGGMPLCRGSKRECARASDIAVPGHLAGRGLLDPTQMDRDQGAIRLPHLPAHLDATLMAPQTG
jgi:hypothetical protein